MTAEFNVDVGVGVGVVIDGDAVIAAWVEPSELSILRHLACAPDSTVSRYKIAAAAAVPVLGLRLGLGFGFGPGLAAPKDRWLEERTGGYC